MHIFSTLLSREKIDNIKIAFSNKQSRKEIKKTIIYNSIQRIKHLGINPIKEVKDLYIKNYKIFLREIN